MRCQQRLLALALPSILVPLVAGPWSGLTFENVPSQGFDTHGPCPSVVGGITYTDADCVQPKKGDNGEYLPPECSAAMGGLSFHGFAQCFSSVTSCWSTAGTVFAKLPQDCNVGEITTSIARFEANGGGVVCPGSAIVIAADGSMALATAQPLGCWNMRLDGVGYRPFGVMFLLVFAVVTVVYLVGGVAFAIRTKGAPPTLRSHPHAALWEEVRALCEDGVAFARSQTKGGSAGSAAGYVPVENPKPSRKAALTDKAETDRTRGDGQESSKRRKKEKKEKKDKQVGVEQRDAEPSLSAPAPAAPAPPASIGTASAGGGRWVHVPN